VAPRLSAQLDLETLIREVTDVATTLLGAEFASFFHNRVNGRHDSGMLYTLSSAAPRTFTASPYPATILTTLISRRPPGNA